MNGSGRKPTLALSVAAVLLGLLLIASRADAHAMGVSRGDYTVDGTTIHAVVVLRADEVAVALPGLDANVDGQLSDAEVQRATPAWRTLVREVGLSTDGSPCAGKLTSAVLVPLEAGADVRVSADFTCAVRDSRAPKKVLLHAGFLERLAAGHRHFATVYAQNGSSSRLLVAARPDLEVDVGSQSPGQPHHLTSLVRAGVEHILTGWDHLAFLAALLLGCVRTRRGGEDRTLGLGSIVTLLTAFTIGHSVSLAVATLAGLAPAARFVEPAVALSVAYVGAENLGARPLRRRWMLTLPFGFVHGFAFAGGLLPLGVPRAQLPVALLGFNVGVELGQLAVLAALLPLLLLTRSRTWYPRTTRLASGLIAILGVIWFLQRIASAISTSIA